MDLKNIWKSWGDIHEQESQLKRINSAKKIACTPISIDKSNYSAVFQGKKIRYSTSLEECSCVDFSRNKQPCKHIYRLALELGIIKGEYESNILKVIDQLSPNDAIAMIDSISEESQKILREFLYNHLYHNHENLGFVINDNIIELIKHNIFIVVDDIAAAIGAYKRNELNNMIEPFSIPGFKKNLKKERLIEWVIDTAPEIIPELTSASTAVTINPMFTKTKRRVYIHLNNKFREDLDWI
ncbi:SWIM zinc finger domain-containing protein [Lysinibacillus sp. CD3-6]|uniref:SWIM zinc finger family protein n=1 Tax=Lysinibacillus sp. CD3-6 TaxID=2892541 RepID=UPI0011680B95|nr:SWIM zinc finger family protein [Lysinibacillus sp. CD3-6]UED78400.1 SWIM zinc finger domain-containing protein [Lysinibacillus sp. CD3-6]